MMTTRAIAVEQAANTARVIVTAHLGQDNEALAFSTAANIGRLLNITEGEREEIDSEIMLAMESCHPTSKRFLDAQKKLEGILLLDGVDPREIIGEGCLL